MRDKDIVCCFRESLIDHLQQQINRQRQELHRVLTDHQRIVEDLQTRLTRFESDLLLKVKIS